MKKIKHLLPLLLIAVLLMGLLPLGAFAQEGASTDPAEATPTPAAPGDIVSSGSSSEEAPPPAETAAPTATPAPTPTPTAEPTPTATPTPTEAPEVYPSSENEPYFEEPWGEGIFEGPNNPPEGSPLLMTIAAGTATIAVRGCYDSSGNVIKYASSFYYDGRWVGGYGSSRHTIYANEEPAYCLEPGKYLVGGNTVTTNAATIWNGFSSDKREAIKLAILCGAEGNASNLSGSYGSQYTATQMIVWEFIVGVRNTESPYSVTNNKVINSVCYNGANPEVKTVYDQISAAMVAYNTLPSFANSLQAPPMQIDLQYSNGTYSLTLTDSNNVLSNYNVSCTDNNVKLSVSGNKLTMTSTAYVPGAMVNLTRKSTVAASSQIVAYGGSDLQETVMGIEAVSGTSGYISIKSAYIPKGNLKIVKTSDDGKVAGITFTVTGPGISTTVTTGPDGAITIPDLTPGVYTVTEQVPERYVCDTPSQTVTVADKQTATVSFANRLKMWRVTVTKVDAEANMRRSSGATLVGAVYGIYKDGALLDSYTIDESDQFVTKLYPCGTGYELKEITPPTGYTLDPNSYPVGLEPGTVELAANDTAITVPETIIKGKLVIVKQDALTQTPLAGAVFTVYDETGASVTEGATGEDGTFTVDELPYGKYTAKETTPPDGYQLDETVFDFAIETDGQIVTLTRDNIYCVGSITVHKVDTQGSALSGTTYLLEWSEDGSTWAPVVFREGTTPTIGGCTSLGLESGQLTTGEDGSVLFDGLVANGKVYYRLTEVSTQPGLSLLKDPVFQGTLPLEGETEKEYDISYTVTNNRITTLPQTGGSGLLLPVTISTALLGLAGCTGVFVVRRNKAKSGKEN